MKRSAKIVILSVFPLGEDGAARRETLKNMGTVANIRGLFL